MIEFRYFYYLVAVNMLSQVIMFAPYLLLRERFNGSVLAILLAVPIGTTLLALSVYSVRQFPKATLPEILATVCPNWLRLTLMVQLILMWSAAGSITLVSITEISNRYILPDTSRLAILLLFGVLGVLTVRMKSDRLLYGIEVLFLFNAPLIAFILGKALFEPTLSWRAMAEIGTHVNKAPTLGALSASTFVFTGYLNMVIFNRTIQGHLTKWPLVAIAFFGLLTLLTSFFIPIGIHGTSAVVDFPFPWVFTADSLRMEFFFIERVVFPFLLLYIMIALISVFIHWHVGMEMTKETFPMKKKWVEWLVLGGMLGGALLLHFVFPVTAHLATFVSYWFIARFLSEIGLVAILVYAARRQKQA